MRNTALILGSLLFTTVACGGGDPPKEPPTTSSTTAEPPATTPPPAADPAPAPAPVADAKPAVEEPPALVFDGLKVTPKGGKMKALEVKADGTVVSDGKTIATFSKNELHDDTGATAYAVKKDGTVEGSKVTKPVSFNDKDELGAEGKKWLSVGDDGAVKLEKDGGKSENAPYKVEGVTAKNKRAALLLIAYLHAAKDAAKKDGATAAGKPGDAAKPAGKADAKPAAKK